MTSPAPAAVPRSVSLALILLTAALVGTAAGFLAWAGGINPPMAVLTGGSTFGGTGLFLLAIVIYATGGRGVEGTR